MSNKDVIDGKLKQVEGKVQDAIGDLTGDIKHDIEGKAKQVEGKLQEVAGHVDNAVQSTIHNAFHKRRK